MVKSGEVDALVAERVWKELERALQEKTPAEFFHVLSQCGALPVLFPALKEQNIKALSQAAIISTDAEVRFAALLYDLSPQQIRDLCDRYRVPGAYRELALLVASRQDDLNTANLAARDWLALLQAADAFRREARFKKFLVVCEAVFSLRQVKGFSPAEPQKILAIYNVAKLADIKKLMGSGAAGKEIASLLSSQRTDLIEKFIKNPQK
jgi:tRNA nucleotidyltransferase (CCA-adding enzyme)